MSSVHQDQEQRTITPEHFPNEGKHDVVWMCWKDEGTKVPKIPGTKRNARTNHPGDLRSYEETVKAYEDNPDYYDGVAVVFQDDDPYFGIDLDGCRDPETGIIDEWAREIIENHATYSEVSPSKTGIKMWGIGRLPFRQNTKKFVKGERPGIEVYDGGKWFAVTGWHLEGTPRVFKRRQSEVTKLIREHWPEKFAAPKASTNRNGNGSTFNGSGGLEDLEAWLSEHNVPVFREAPDRSGRKWVLRECPRTDRHSTADASGAYVVQLHGGGFYAGCSHAGCGNGEENIWHDVRQAYEPGYVPYEERKIRPSSKRHQNKNGDDSNDSNDSDEQRIKDLPEPEKFPVEVFPPVIEQFIKEAAGAIGCPVDYIGLSTLAALSGGIGDTRRIVIKNNWTEGASIYGLIVGESATKKTPAINTALRPVRERQGALQAEYERQKEEYESALEDYAKAKKGGPTELRKPEKPILGRTWVDDTTVERLADILNENRRGICVIKDELSGWLGSMNQYKQGGKGADRQFWLSVHSNQPVSVDRKSAEEPVIVPHPWVSIVGGIQPKVLPDFGSDRGDGLIDRFLAVYPAPCKTRWTFDELSDATHNRYNHVIQNLYRLRYANDDRDPFPSRVPMSEGAKPLFIEAYNKLHEELEAPGFPDRLRAPWGKLEAYLARFALILAMTSRASLTDPGPREFVTTEDMEGAIRLLEYFKNHARRLYTGLYGDNPSDRLAADLREFLIERDGRWEGTASELYAALLSDYKPERPEDLSKAIRAIVKRSPLLRIEDLRTGQRRGFRLTLEEGESQ